MPRSPLFIFTRCGIADVPLPNGKFYFVFEPDKESIPVVKIDP
jgi:hypothetical protein